MLDILGELVQSAIRTVKNFDILTLNIVERVVERAVAAAYHELIKALGAPLIPVGIEEAKSYAAAFSKGVFQRFAIYSRRIPRPPVNYYKTFFYNFAVHFCIITYKIRLVLDCNIFRVFNYCNFLE